MEMLAIPVAEETAAESQWDAAPPRFEDQDLDILAFELWQRANRVIAADDEDWQIEEEALRGHASCL